MLPQIRVITNITPGQLARKLEEKATMKETDIMRRLWKETTIKNKSVMGHVYTEVIVNNRIGYPIEKWDGKSDVVMLWWFSKAVTDWVMDTLRRTAPDWPWEKPVYKPIYAVDSSNPPKYKGEFELGSRGEPIATVTELEDVVEVYNVALYARRLEPDWGNAMVKKGYHVKIPTGVMTSVAEAAQARYKKAARVMFTFEDYRSDRYPVIKIRLPRAVLNAMRPR